MGSTRSAVLVALVCIALQAAPAASAAAFYSSASASGSVVTTNKLCDEGDTVLSMLKAIARTPRLDTRVYSRHESAQVTAVQALARQAFSSLFSGRAWAQWVATWSAPFVARSALQLKAQGVRVVVVARKNSTRLTGAVR